MTQLAVIENNLQLMAPKFEDVLAAYQIPVARLMRTVMIGLERLPALLDCTMPSILNGAMSAAVLGLEMDGVSGQGFLIPFKGKAQLVIGYKGYNTIAARSGYTINGNVVREGDAFDFTEGTQGFVQHKRQLGNESARKIVAAWAVAEKPGSSPIVSVLSIDELMAVKAKSPGAKKSDSPWNDPAVGFPAMCAKTAKRRLARSMPLNTMQLAAAMEEQTELGRHAHITPDKGVVIEGNAQRSEAPADAPDPTQPERFTIYRPSGEIYKTLDTIEQYIYVMRGLIEAKAGNEAELRRVSGPNSAALLALKLKHKEVGILIEMLGREGIELIEVPVDD